MSVLGHGVGPLALKETVGPELSRLSVKTEEFPHAYTNGKINDYCVFFNFKYTFWIKILCTFHTKILEC